MRRPNGRCSLSGLVWPSPDSTSSHLQISDAVRIRQRQLLGETVATTPFRAPGTGFFAAETAARNRPCARPENERLKGRIGKARRQRAFSARLHMSAANVNAWWRRHSGSNRSRLSNSRLSGKRIGNFVNSRGDLPVGGKKQPVLPRLNAKFPVKSKREFFGANREI